MERVTAARLGGVVVVLENLHDPHNGGAVLRSCEAVGLLEIHVVGGEFAASERVTQGSDKWLDIRRDKGIESCASDLKARGFKLYASIPGAEIPLEELDPIVPAAFLMGNEHAGLTDGARALCDAEYALPLQGFSQSLNLSVATAITVYTHARRRRLALGRNGDLDEEALDRLRARYLRKDVRGADAIVARHLARTLPAK